MQARTMTSIVAVALTAGSVWGQGGQPPSERVPLALAGERSISGPYTHENLTLYLVHGEETAKGQRFVTLQEALDRKSLKVHETGEVNELAIENLSDDVIFIQSGDIVRGGKQDRLFAMDVIVEPKSGRMPVASFCVEQGRWAGRGGESQALFSSSANLAPSNAIKLAAKKSGDQRGVWAGVAAAQRRLRASLKQEVAARASETSLELTLDNPEIQKQATDYAKSLGGVLEGRADAIGVVVVINGRLISADVYGTTELFRALWPKLLESCAVEAIAAREEPKAAALPTAEDARAFLSTAQGAAPEAKAVSERVRMVVRETDADARFETVDIKNGGALIHTNCLRKTPVPAAAASSQPSRP